MKYIRVKDSFADDAPEYTYPMYELNAAITPNSITRPESWRTIGTANSRTESDFCTALYYTGTDLSNIFIDWQAMPRVVGDDGTLIKTRAVWAYGDNMSPYKFPQDSKLTPMTIGTKPDNWDTDYMYYGTGFASNGWFYDETHFIYIPIPATNNSIQWNSGTQYYYNNPDDRDYRINRIFVSLAGGRFSISSLPLQGYAGGYWATLYRLGGHMPYADTDQSAYWEPYNTTFIFDDEETRRYLLPIPNGDDNTAGTMLGFMPCVASTSDRNTGINVFHNQFFCFVYFKDPLRQTMRYGIALINMSADDGGVPTIVRVLGLDIKFWGEDSISDSPTPEQPSNFGDDTTPQGGNGNFISVSDNRIPADVFSLTSGSDFYNRSLVYDFLGNAGYHIYKIANMTSALESEQLASIVFALYGNSFFNRFQNSMYNPLSCILTCHLLPSNLVADTRTSPSNFRAAGYDFTADAAIPQFYLLKGIKIYKVGEISISNYFGAFPDYAGYTRIILHLPYIGDCEIDTNSIMHGKLILYYVCDNFNGNVAAWVFTQDAAQELNPENIANIAPKYVFTGNAAYTLPLFSQQQNGLAVGKILAGVTELAGGIMTGNAIPALTGAANLTSSIVESKTRHTAKTGGISGNSAMISDCVAWLEIIRPQWVNPANYKMLKGIPAKLSGILQDFTGFVVVNDIDIINSSATSAEIAEIETILRGGVFHNPPEESEPESV